jgi:ankyrin repeat protein
MPNPDRALLAAAVRRDALQAVRDALVQGAQVNAARPDGRTALMLAAERGDAALIQLLLDAGADTQRLDREGLSAADWARRSGQTHVLPLLQSLPGR